MVFICTKTIQNIEEMTKLWPFYPCEVAWFHWELYGTKGILWWSFVPKRFKIGQEMAKFWQFSFWEVAWFHWEPYGTKGNSMVFICTKKTKNWSKNDWIIAIFSLRGCVNSLGTRWDKGGCFGVHLYQKDPKSVKKWLSYGHFPTKRLCDSIENNMG